MKKKLCLALAAAFCILALSACTKRAESSSAIPGTAPLRAPDATPILRLKPSAVSEPVGIAPSLNDDGETADYWEMIELMYSRVGNLYFGKTDLPRFQSELDQTQPVDFVVTALPTMGPMGMGAQSDEEELSELYARMEELESHRHEAGYEVSEEQIALGARIMALSAELEAEQTLATAREFKRLGLEVQLRSSRSVEQGQEILSYICILRASPQQLWELSESIEGRYFLDEVRESLLIRYDTLVPIEEAEP